MFKTKPRDYQLELFEHTKEKPSFALLLDMGLGKSKITVDTISHLYKTGKIDSVFLTVRKSVIDNWHDPNFSSDPETEFNKHMWEDIDYKVFSWDGLKSRKQEKALQAVHDFKGLKIYAVNIEAFQARGKEFFVRIDKILDHLDLSRTMIVIDEAADIKNPTANRTKAIFKSFNDSAYKRLLTGTPVTEAAEDCFSIYEFMEKKYFGFPTYSSFKNYYCVYRTMQLATHSFKQKIGYRNLDQLKEKLNNYDLAKYLKKEDVLHDLPGKTYKKIFVDLTPEQKKFYKQMASELTAYLGSSELELTSTSQKVMKLLQITAGVLHFEDKQLALPGKNPKIEATMELIDSFREGEKVVIFSLLRSKVLIKTLVTALKEKYGEEAVIEYTGDTPKDQRQSLIRQFQDPDSPIRIFVGNNAAARGITLTASCKEIFFTAGYSADERMQAEDRCNRIGQNSQVEVYDIIARGTPDKTVLAALQKKKDLMKYLLEHKEKSELLATMKQLIDGDPELAETIKKEGINE